MANEMVKIVFELDPDDWHGTPVETMWAEPVAGRSPGVFQIHNSPFYVRGISFLDLVVATPTEYEIAYDFGAVLERGGHSTFMILMEPEDSRVRFFWGLLERIGCSYESATEDLSIGVRTLYSVDVPPTTDIDEVFRILDKGEADGVWVYQTGYVHRAGSPEAPAT
jgi:hypothetical protein